MYLCVLKFVQLNRAFVLMMSFNYNYQNALRHYVIIVSIFSFVKNLSCVTQICITKIAAKYILVVVVRWCHHGVGRGGPIGKLLVNLLQPTSLTKGVRTENNAAKILIHVRVCLGCFESRFEQFRVKEIHPSKAS